MLLARFEIVTASILTLMAGTAIAGPPADSPRRASLLATAMGESHADLVSAINAAEKACGGTAIRARVAMSRDLDDMSMSADRANMNRSDRRQPNPEASPDTIANRSLNEPTENRTVNAYEHSVDALYAVVTCVIGESRVRDVIVDLRNNQIVGVTSVLAPDNATRQDYDPYPDAVNNQGMNLLRATDLLNASVRNARGDRVGNIDDLAIDPDNNRAVYGVLRRGGFMGLEESRYAIPTDELSGLHNGRLMINLNNDDFKGHEGFDNKNWPTHADQQWDCNWTDNGTPETSAKRVIKASAIIGAVVQYRDGKTLGKISDLVMDPVSGHIAYAVIKTDRGQMPVPMPVLQRKGDTFTTQLTSQELASKPVIDSDQEPNWNDARWNRKILESYGVKPDPAFVSEKSVNR